jgi:hypothetical protein
MFARAAGALAQRFDLLQGILFFFLEYLILYLTGDTIACIRLACWLLRGFGILRSRRA